MEWHCRDDFDLHYRTVILTVYSFWRGGLFPRQQAINEEGEFLGVSSWLVNGFCSRLDGRTESSILGTPAIEFTLEGVEVQEKVVNREEGCLSLIHI